MDAKTLVNNIYNTALGYPDKTFKDRGKAYTCINPYSYHIYKSHKDLYASLDGLFVDGMTMCWWIRLLWKKKVRRLSFDMSGMAVDLFAYLNSEGCEEDIYFIGAKPDQVSATVNHMRRSYPLMKINGFRDGYFKDNDERMASISEIIARNPDYVIVGMGSPLQEQFAVDLRDSGFKGIIFTCGGFLHQTVRRMVYYPEWINKYNLRAFYRLYREKDTFKRLWQVLVMFPVQFSIDSVKSKLSRGKSKTPSHKKC